MRALPQLLAVCLAAGPAAGLPPGGEKPDVPPVVEIAATGVWTVAGEDSVIEAKATSPAGCDLSTLHWCLCDSSGAAVSSWKRQSVAGRAKRLKVNLPAGAYRLRATDGTWFYGSVPVNVLRRENPYAARDGAPTPLAVREPPDPPPASGAARFWRDVNRGAFSRPDARSRTPRRSVVALCATPADGGASESPEALADLVDRTAAWMKYAGANVLAYPGPGHHGLVGAHDPPRGPASDALSAWYAKFDCEGLSLYPTVDLDALSGFDVRAPKAWRHVDSLVDALLDQGAAHPSFAGVCLRTARPCDRMAEHAARAAQKIAARRPGLTLWICGPGAADGPDRARLAQEIPNLVLWTAVGAGGMDALRQFVEPFRSGDVLGVAKAGGLPADPSGREDALVPFIQAFRALPAVAFDDVDAAMPDGVRLRQATYGGMSWFYVVNTGSKPVRVALEVPARTRDLVADARVGGLLGAAALDLVLKPCELRSYAAPAGQPKGRKP